MSDRRGALFQPSMTKNRARGSINPVAEQAGSTRIVNQRHRVQSMNVRTFEEARAQECSTRARRDVREGNSMKGSTEEKRRGTVTADGLSTKPFRRRSGCVQPFAGREQK